MSARVIRWRDVDGRTYRAHDPRHEGKRYPSREEAERVMRRFAQNDGSHAYWVDEVQP